ncbi:Importin N-terminal domain-containing protein [Mucor velutinosus]|uniref:Importin N-terminal domain-containing protein n=1 Tax=Mucor velutinosus TaxID=708070 RepID=A0AAN7HY89_9FUNG|nr:Importin N-terminal domain-containing protein [Mucor velutinosus]
MNSSYHKTSTENGYKYSDARRQTRYASDNYDSHRQSGSRASEREKDISNASRDSAYSNKLLINRDEIVLGYPEKVIPAKEPVISLDIEDDEERIMQADWGNESDDEEDHVTTQKQHKRLSTVEREEIEKVDRELKEVWVRHAADDGRPYFYNSVTRESVWEIPKSAAATPVATCASTASTRTASSTTNTHTTVNHAKTDHASNPTITHPTRTGSDRSSRPDKIPSDALPKQSQPRSKSAPTASTSSNDAEKATAVNRHLHHAKEKDDTKAQVPTKNDVSISTNTNTENGQKSKCATKSTKMTLQSTERRMSYSNREVSQEKRSKLEILHSSHRSGYISRRSRSRSPLPPPPPRDLYYDDYRYHHRSPSPPPYRRYPPYERYAGYYPYSDRIRHSPPPPPPELRYRHYNVSPPPPLSPPSYYRSRERNWERYEAAHRSRYYR